MPGGIPFGFMTRKFTDLRLEAFSAARFRDVFEAGCAAKLSPDGERISIDLSTQGEQAFLLDKQTYVEI